MNYNKKKKPSYPPTPMLHIKKKYPRLNWTGKKYILTHHHHRIICICVHTVSRIQQSTLDGYYYTIPPASIWMWIYTINHPPPSNATHWWAAQHNAYTTAQRIMYICIQNKTVLCKIILKCRFFFCEKEIHLIWNCHRMNIKISFFCACVKQKFYFILKKI